MSLYKNGWGFELRATENKSSKWSERDSNPGPTDCVSDISLFDSLCRLRMRSIGIDFAE